MCPLFSPAHIGLEKKGGREGMNISHAGLFQEGEKRGKRKGKKRGILPAVRKSGFVTVASIIETAEKRKRKGKGTFSSLSKDRRDGGREVRRKKEKEEEEGGGALLISNRLNSYDARGRVCGWEGRGGGGRERAGSFRAG